MKRIDLNFLKTPILQDLNALSLVLLNAAIVIFQIGYIFFRVQYLNPEIPLWYTKPWGTYQLTEVKNIFVIPLTSIYLLIVTFFIINRLYISRSKEALYTTLTLLTISISFLTISLMRIITKASVPYPHVLPPQMSQLVTLALVTFVICALLVPLVIKFARAYGMVTYPSDKHPGMALKMPSARAGGLAFYLAFVIAGVLFVPITKEFVGLYIGAFITTLIGIADDKKNLSPYLRLLMMPLAIITTLVISDLHIHFFANPFNGTVIRLDTWQIPLRLGDLKFTFIPVADLFTTFWILWFMNMLSWSNGIDGQFSGMVGITCLVTAILALRLLKIDPEQIYVAKLAAIAAGACLGILPYNWHPSKIMWGFGATTMGLIIPILSIMAGTKVAVATLVLIVPTLDSIVTIGRRLLQKKNPLKGDRGHLHQRLLDMGYSHQRIAIFYWIVTGLTGAIALVSSGQAKILAVLTLGGVIAFALIIMNLKGELGKLRSRAIEK